MKALTLIALTLLSGSTSFAAICLEDTAVLCPAGQIDQCHLYGAKSTDEHKCMKPTFAESGKDTAACVDKKRNTVLVLNNLQLGPWNGNQANAKVTVTVVTPSKDGTVASRRIEMEGTQAMSTKNLGYDFRSKSGEQLWMAPTYGSGGFEKSEKFEIDLVCDL